MLKKQLEKALDSRTEDGSTLPKDLVYTFELVPARASKGKAIDEIISLSKQLASGGKICALSITDNAGGHPALAPEALGSDIKSLGVEPIIHFSCKDKNRNLIESELFELDRMGLNTLLVLTGDYPRFGYKGQAKPVFDLDSVLVLSMIEDMKKGLVIDEKAPGGGIRLPQMEFYAGCVVSPFKKTVPEQVQQYLKLKRKIKAGAKFVITQLGYDIRKYHELRMIIDILDLNIPLVGTVFIPTLPLARIIHKGSIPGCTIPLTLLKEYEHYNGDKRFFEEQAAKLIALLAGIGYQGIHLSGPGLCYEDIENIIQKAESLMPDWQELINEFIFDEEWDSHIFKKDPNTLLNTNQLLTRGKKAKFPPGLSQITGILFHKLFFEPERALYNKCKQLARCIEKKGLSTTLARFEYFFKELLYDCQRCGDCYLGEMEFLCPQSQCAKRLLNGPCGGSHNGICEVSHHGKKCLYVRIHNRAQLDPTVLFKDVQINPPRNWELDSTSSWINFFLKRDHHSLRGE